MSKQTAVKWLVSQLPLGVKGAIMDKIEQAKEMEKQHIIDAYEVAYMDGYNDNGKDGKQYYNETYGDE
jgi:hypothetical protein